jgi:predicted secreted Zn-dependent protease
VLALLARANQARADHNAALFADTYEFALADAGELVRLARAGGPIAETVLQALGYVGTSPNAIWPARSLKTSLLITVIAAAVLAAAVMRADLHGRYVRAVATYSLSQYAAGELWSVGTGGPR